ncbi:MAG: hypothetical protein RM022_016880 [Nostoc sp. EfeVER01]|uniref:hypothetical protein n=1 Tax=unclassified Nostoc TaxID=2593658 RepID=UPI002AD459C4|nr:MULTISPECIES: hypothetical protein [unclassified Nostoc]MDZ7944950.1 hypothetical protein [Nostoc sp. EfeVER01]MDZ7992599.1 hypothetical protein [Nostoc sp. EspVER01]
MLIGMAIAPNLATPANAHESSSTDSVVKYLFFENPCLPSQKEAISECKLVSLCRATLIW